MPASMELMHEILVGMRAEMRENFVDIKNRLNSIEGSMGLLLHEAGSNADHRALINRQIDQLKERVQQLEEKLKAS